MVNGHVLYEEENKNFSILFFSLFYYCKLIVDVAIDLRGRGNEKSLVGIIIAKGLNGKLH